MPHRILLPSNNLPQILVPTYVHTCHIWQVQLLWLLNDDTSFYMHEELDARHNRHIFVIMLQKITFFATLHQKTRTTTNLEFGMHAWHSCSTNACSSLMIPAINYEKHATMSSDIGKQHLSIHKHANTPKRIRNIASLPFPVQKNIY